MSHEIPSASRIYLESKGDAIAEKLNLDPDQKRAVSKTIVDIITSFPPQKDETFESWRERTESELSAIADKNDVSFMTKTKLAVHKSEIEADIQASWEQIREKVLAASEGAAAEKTTKKSAAELQREMLSEGLSATDKETIKAITDIDVNKKTAEQSDEMHRLQLVSTTLFAKVFKSEIPVKDVDTLEKVAKLDVSKLTLNPVEKAAFAKLQEIGNATGKKLNEEMTDTWPRTIQNIRKEYESGNEASKVMTGEKEKTDNKDSNAIIDFAKEHPYATAAIALAGAYGIYKLFFSSNDKEDEKKDDEDEGFFSNIFSKKTAAIVGLLVVGGLIGPEKIKDTLMKFYHMSGERVEKCITLWKQGRYKDAVAALFLGEDKYAKEYTKLAQAISSDSGKEITDDAVQSVANAKYDDFTSLESGVKSFMSQAMSHIPGTAGTIAGLFAESKEKVEQESIIRDYLKKHKDQISAFSPGKEATVFEVLQKLQA